MQVVEEAVRVAMPQKAQQKECKESKLSNNKITVVHS